MSGGNQLHDIALRGGLVWLILAGLVWPSLAQEAKRGDHHPGQSQAEAEQTPTQPPTAPAVSADRPHPQPETKNYWDPCRAPKNADESDLCQQWRMAEAAEETADWTLGQIIATGVEAILLGIAIGVAWWAGSWAKRAAVTGDKTVQVTRDIGVAQTRAYLNVFKAEIRWENRQVARAFVEIKNSGQTPARKVTHWIGIGIGKDVTFGQPDSSQDASKHDLGAGAPLFQSVTTDRLDSATWRSVRTRAIPIFVWGKINYEDVFGNTWHTTYRTVLSGESVNDNLAPCEDGNDST